LPNPADSNILVHCVSGTFIEVILPGMPEIKRGNMNKEDLMTSPNWTSLLHRIHERCRPDQQLVTEIPALSIFHLASPTPAARLFYKPSIALILQGEKTVTIGDSKIRLGAGTFLLASIDIPTFAQVSVASADIPYLSLTLELDVRLVRQLIAAHDFPEPSNSLSRHALAAGLAEANLLDIFNRLVGLLDRPTEIPMMFDLIERELIYRLLLSPEGDQLRRMARTDSQSSRVSKAIDWLKGHYAEPFSMQVLANVAGMGVSTLHHRFRELTSMSPLQYQKSLRLHAARNMMLEEHIDAGSAALRVGYESAAQFNREYRRFFGAPPAQDIKVLRGMRTRQTDL